MGYISQIKFDRANGLYVRMAYGNEFRIMPSTIKWIYQTANSQGVANPKNFTINAILTQMSDSLGEGFDSSRFTFDFDTATGRLSDAIGSGT